MDVKTVIRLLAALVVFGFFVLIGRHFIFGGGKLVSLEPAPPLSGQVSQALGPNSDGSLLSESRDYTISPVYFDNRSWVVVTINSPVTSRNGLVVMKKTDGIYQAAVGPGTAIASSQLGNLPPDVVTYLSHKTAIYDPIPGQK